MVNHVTGDSEDNNLVGIASDTNRFAAFGGDDVMTGNVLGDIFYGGDGNDTAYGAGGDDVFYAGDSNFLTTGMDEIYGGVGDDRVYTYGDGDESYGGADNDTYFRYINADFTLDMASGVGSGGTKAEGFERAVIIHIGSSSFGFGGTISGTEDANYIEGGEGNDNLSGRGGNDTIYGDGGDDELSGGAGIDTIYGGGGSNTLFGGGDGDILSGGSDDSTIYGGSGADRLSSGAGADAFFGGDDFDVLTLSLRNATQFSIVLEGGGTGGDLQGDSYSDDIERFIINQGGVTGNDDSNVVITGTDTGDLIDVGFSRLHTTINAGKGADTIDSLSFGNDRIFGEGGADLIEAEYGIDSIFGGGGDDILSLRRGKQGGIFGGEGNDFLSSSNASNTTYAVPTTLDGGKGNDLLYANNTAFGRHLMYGGDGVDSLFGGRGIDDLYGGSGNDYLLAGRADHLIGGGDDDDYIQLRPNFHPNESGYTNLEIGGGDGTDTLHVDFLRATDTVTVDYVLGKVFVESVDYGNFDFKFFNIETFTSDAQIVYLGEDLPPPDVQDDNLESPIENQFNQPDFFFDGDMSSIRAAMGGGDNWDAFGFTAGTVGFLTITSYRQGYSHVSNEVVIDVEFGDNSIYVTPPSGGWDTRQEYLLEMRFESAKTPQEAAIEGFIRNDMAGAFKLGVVDLGQLGFGLFEVLFENLDQANHLKMMQGITMRLGVLGDIIDIGTKASNISAAFNMSHRLGLRQAYVEVIDFFTGMLTAEAGGFTGTIIGGPVGGIIGGLSAGLTYGAALSNHVKQQAANHFDRMYAEATNGAGAKEGDTTGPETEEPFITEQFDASDLIFDETWYKATYSDAVDAVQSGEYPSYFAYYLTVGIAAGHPPNQGAPVLTAADLAIDLSKLDAKKFAATALFSEAVGEMAGDGLSNAEQSLANEINARRDSDANIDAGLSAVANRLARDWMQNQVADVGREAFLGGVSDWVADMSTGQTFAQTLQDLPGLSAELGSSIKVLGLLTPNLRLNKVVDKFIEDARNAGVLLDGTTLSIGVAEVAGLWIILADTGNANADDAGLSETFHTTTVNGTEQTDDVVAGHTALDAYLLGGNDSFRGGVRADTVDGGDGADQIAGLRGADVLDGGADDDVVEGGQGTDVVSGGDGADTVSGGAAEDTVFGGEGDDDLSGGSGADTLDGQTGNDTISGNAGTDGLFGGGGSDILRGAGGDDTMDGGSGNDTLFGGANLDLLYGGSGDDILEGSSAKDTLFGGSGDDTLKGGNGDDRITGGGGDDVLRGGKGNDLFFGGAGNDKMTGSEGNDDFVFLNNFGIDTITDFSALSGAEDIDFAGVSAITSFADLANKHMAQQGADVVITVGANSLTLKGVNIGDLDGTDFLF